MLLLLLAAGSALQWNVGLADNGDYTRHMLWYSSGPVGFAENWPTDDEGYAQRFFNHSLAYWSLDVPLSSRWVSSILLMWLPGVLANLLFYSSDTLYLPFLSFAPRLLGLLFLILLFRWIDSVDRKRSIALYLSAGIPLVLLLVNTDYVAYFTSFYQEPASLMSLLLLIAVLLWYRRRGDTPWMPWLLSAAVFAIQTAKLSNVYWAGLVLIFVFPWSMLRGTPKRAALYLLLVFVLPFGLSLGQATFYHSRTVNAYQSIFCGVLVFSDKPQEHLDRHGMSDGMKYLDYHAYCEEGRECIHRYKDKLNHRTVLSIIAHEPVLAWRMLRFSADSVQQTKLTHLGNDLKLNIDSDHVKWETAWQPDGALADALSSWSRIKSTVFPTGKAFLLSVALLLLIFILTLRRGGPVMKDLAWIGMLLLLACVGDMWIQVFGDGKRDLIKHLFLVNVLYDIAVIIAVNLLFLAIPWREKV